MLTSTTIAQMFIVVVEVAEIDRVATSLSPSDSDLMRENWQINAVVNSNLEYLRFWNI